MSAVDRERLFWLTGMKLLVLSRGQALLDFVKELELVQMVSLLSLFLAVIFTFEHWLFEATARVCLLLFLLRPNSIRSPVFWLALSLSATFVIIHDWQAADNHKYLLLYWLWILFFCHLFGEPEQKRRTLIFNARFFLCFIFLAAAAQKLASPTYRSGEMFEYFLYVDSRFTAFGKLIGIDPTIPDAVQKSIGFFRSPFSQVIDNDLVLPGSDRARIAALVLTWWDLSLQLLIGSLLFLRRPRTDKFAHILLLFFVFTTYLPAPVFGFGWILAIMGFTLAKENFPRIAAVYMSCFVVILLYQVPWREWVLAM
ncbi:MAG: hypothetical protein QOI04_1160 [Verrucomicrobiota bacterium]|jgi:hypothetical protein